MRKAESVILSVLSWIHAVLIFSGWYLLLPFFMTEGVQADMHLWQCLWLTIPVILSFFANRKIRNLVVYLLLSFAGTYLLFLASKSLWTAVCSEAIFLIRCYTRIEKGKIRKMMRDFPGETGRFYEPEAWEIPTFLDQPKLYHGLIFLVQYLILIFTGNHAPLKSLFSLMAAEIFVIFLFQYVDRMQKYIIGRKSVSNLPVKMIFRNGYAIFLPMIFIVLFAMTPAFLYGKEPLTGLYHAAEVKKVQEMETFEGMEQKPDPLMQMLLQMQEEEKESPAWMIWLSNVLSVLTLACMAAVLFFVMLRGVRRVMGAFAEADEDEVINLKQAADEEKKLRRKKKREERRRKDTREYKVRRQYKKIILKYGSEKPQGMETPTELEERADLTMLSDPAAFHEIYEKARYGKNGVSEEELQRFEV